MTTVVAFQPPPEDQATFDVQMDGSGHRATVPYSVFGQRYYLRLEQNDRTVVFLLPVIGSPMARQIEAVTWFRGRVTITLVRRHGYSPGQTVRLTVIECVPSVLNGRRLMLCDDDRTLSFALDPDPGPVTVLGRVSHDIDIAEGYFEQSTLVFRQQAQQFEVNP